MSDLEAVTPFLIGVIEPDPDVRDKLVGQIDHLGQVAKYPSLEAFTEAAAQGTPFVLILGPSMGTPEVLAKFEDIQLHRPEVKAIAVLDELTPRLLQQAMRSGIDDVVAVEDGLDQLEQAVIGAGEKLLYFQAVTPAAGGAESAGSSGDLEGKVITVFSAKGGAGKSVVASNLAVQLAKQTKEPVVLVDGDLQFGDLAVMLRIQPRHTVVDAVASIGRVDSTLLRGLLVRHDSSGVLVLPAPLEPSFADQVTGPDMVAILGMLRQVAKYVIVDTPSQLSDVVISVLEDSDEVLLVTGMDIPNIKNVKIVLQSLRQLQFPMDRIKLILNRSDPKVRLDVAEVEKTLQLKAEAVLPPDVAVARAVNRGAPVVLDAPKSDAAVAFTQLTAQISGVAAAPAEEEDGGRGKSKKAAKPTKKKGRFR